MKLEGAEAINQLEELANLVKYQIKSADSQVPNYEHTLLS